jgi:hypothetical protein
MVVRPVREARFFQISLWLLLALWWSGSIGLSEWSPVVLVHRVWLPPAVLLAINAAYGFYSFNEISSEKERRRISITSILFLSAAFVALLWSRSTHIKLGVPQHFNMVAAAYALVVLVLNFTLCLKLPHRTAGQKIVRQAVPACVVIILIAGLLYQQAFVSNKYMFRYHEEKALVLKLEKELHGRDMVAADAALTSNYDIFTGGKQQIHFINFQQNDSAKYAQWIFIQHERFERLVNNVNQSVVFRQAEVRIPAYVINPRQYGFSVADSNSTAVIWIKEH